MKKLIFVLFTIVVAINTACQYVQAQPFKPEVLQQQAEEQRPGVRITTKSGQTIVYNFPTIEELKQKLLDEGYNPKFPGQTDEQLYTYLAQMGRLCARKAMVAIGVMALKIDGGEIDKMLDLVEQLREKYKMPRYVSVAYERVVRSGFRTRLTPEEFIEDVFIECVALGF